MRGGHRCSATPCHGRRALGRIGMHGLARKVAGLAEEFSWRSDAAMAAMEWMDGDGQRRMAMVLLGGWAGWMDGWMEGSRSRLLALTRLTPASKQAEAELAKSSAWSSSSSGRRCWLAGWQTPDTSDTRSGRLHIVDGCIYINSRVLPTPSIEGNAITCLINYYYYCFRGQHTWPSSIHSVTRAWPITGGCWPWRIRLHVQRERCASLASTLPLLRFCPPSASGTPPNGHTRALTCFCM